MADQPKLESFAEADGVEQGEEKLSKSQLKKLQKAEKAKLKREAVEAKKKAEQV